MGTKMKVKLFAKERLGLNEAITFLKQFTNDVEFYVGKLGDAFPEHAINSSCDLIISYMSPWIIPKEVLNTARLYAINFHPGPPEYPGIGCTNFALYDEVKEFGVTCHLMEAEVDSGRLISVKRFPIYNDSVETLTNRCYRYICIQFDEVVTEIFKNGKLSFLNETWVKKPYTRKQLNALCELNLKMSEEEIRRRVKALYYPNMPGAYLKIGDMKFEFTKR